MIISEMSGDLCCLFTFGIASAVIVLAWLTAKEESQKIDDLPILATYRSGTSAMLSSGVKGPVAHGSTR